MSRRTKIVATLGPASSEPADLDRLLRAGVDVVRLNLSHGTAQEHVERLHAVRASAARVGRHVAVLADLPGPKVRSGPFPDGGAFLQEGSAVRLVPGDGPCTADQICVDYPSLLVDLRAGDGVILGDGAIVLRVTEMGPDAAVARVEAGGPTQGRPGIHIPAERLRLTTPTDHDLELLEVMKAEGADFVAVSFVRAARDVAIVKDACGPRGPRVVAKIETALAIADLDAILLVADAVMVARGDLGIECPLEDVPHLQKRIVRAGVEAGVPVITATQMLESMITAPAPTRAEVSDVANAVLDGTDAVMLSAETAIGHDPELVVRTMARIAERAEQQLAVDGLPLVGDRVQPIGGLRLTQGITRAAWFAATEAGAAAILCCTRSGLTARAMARHRPSAALVGLSPDETTLRAMALTWGLQPLQVETYASTDEMVWFAIETAVRNALVKTGDIVAVLAGAPDNRSDGETDVLRLVRVR
jgi:pyruvate kinase